MMISLDPGIVSSATGVAVWNDKGKLVKLKKFNPDKKNRTLSERIWPLLDFIQNEFDYESSSVVVVEETLYRGKANRTHQQWLGVLQFHFGIATIAPTSVKKWVTGHGRASKEEVVKALYDSHLDKREQALLKNYLKKCEEYGEDISDAVAIGVAYKERTKHGE